LSITVTIFEPDGIRVTKFLNQMKSDQNVKNEVTQYNCEKSSHVMVTVSIL